MKNKMQIKMVRGKNCFYANLATALSFYGYHYSEAELFFLSDSAECFFYETEEKGLNEVLTMYSCDEAADKIADILLLNKKAYNYSHTKKGDVEKFINDAKACLRSNIPIICMMNQKVLYYQPQYYVELQEARHGIIMYGYDDEKQIYYIGDSFVMDSQGRINSYEGELSAELLINNLYGYMWLEPDIGGKRVIIKKTDIVHVIINNLKKMLYSSKEINIYSGNDAIKRGFQYLIGKVYSESMESEELLMFIHFLKMRYIIIFEYIIDIVNALDSTNMLWNKIESIKNQWDYIITRMLMLTYSKTSVKKMGSKVNALIDKQEDVIKEVIGFLNNIIS